MRLWLSDISQLECRVHGMQPVTDGYLYDDQRLSDTLDRNPTLELHVVTDNETLATRWEYTTWHRPVDCPVAGCPASSRPADNPLLALRTDERNKLRTR